MKPAGDFPSNQTAMNVSAANAWDHTEVQNACSPMESSAVCGDIGDRIEVNR
jgi:hypothetical protein